MRVLCINEHGWAVRVRLFFGLITSWAKGNGPAYGDIDEVTGEGEQDGKAFYLLEAWPNARYDAQYFIPLSDLDETQFNRETKKQLTVA